MKGLIFEFTNSNNIPKILNTDIEKVKQIITNLISNAIKYTLKGKINIHLEYKSPIYTLTVKDVNL